MYAAHFAAGLAIKSRAPRAPTWALLTGAFVPDFLWIGLAVVGVEPTARAVFFDDWSHSLATTLLWAILFAACFWRQGTAVVLPVGLAVVSHFLLDLPIHPKPLALYPHSALHLSLGLGEVSRTTYWWVQLATLLVLCLVYAQGAHACRVPLRRITAFCLLVLSLHLMMLL